MSGRVGVVVGGVLAVALVGAPVRPQGEAVVESVRTTLAAWTGGDFDRIAELDGSIATAGGMSLSGSWRYAETRVLVDGVWKVVQYHFSQTAPGL